MSWSWIHSEHFTSFPLWLESFLADERCFSIFSDQRRRHASAKAPPSKSPKTNDGNKMEENLKKRNRRNDENTANIGRKSTDLQLRVVWGHVSQLLILNHDFLEAEYRCNELHLFCRIGGIVVGGVIIIFIIITNITITLIIIIIIFLYLNHVSSWLDWPFALLR